MTEQRLGHGPLISTVGAALLAVSVFLPWYSLSFTASGVAYSQQQLEAVATQLGNSTLQSDVNALHSRFAGLAGHQLATLSAHDALRYMRWVLLILAAIAFTLALLRLAGATERSPSANGQLALVGAIAALCVLFRIVDPPVSPEGLVALSLSWGIWLSLASSFAIVAGAVWPSRIGRASDPKRAAHALEGLSGWTPEG
jgi:hypothetical protein